MVIDHLEEPTNSNLKAMVPAGYRDRFFAVGIDAFIFFPFASLVSYPWMKIIRMARTTAPDSVELGLLTGFYVLTFIFAVALMKGFYRYFSVRTPGEKALGITMVPTDGHRQTQIFWASFWREWACWLSLCLFALPWIHEVSKGKRIFFYDRLTETCMMGLIHPDESTTVAEAAMIALCRPFSRFGMIVISMSFGFFLAGLAAKTQNMSFTLAAELKNIESCEFPEEMPVQDMVDLETIRYLKNGKNAECLSSVKDILLKAYDDETRDLGLIVGVVMSADDKALRSDYATEICSSGNLYLCAWASAKEIGNLRESDMEKALPGLVLTSGYYRLNALKNDKSLPPSDVIKAYQQFMGVKVLKDLFRKEYMTFLFDHLDDNKEGGREPASERNVNLEYDLLKREIEDL
ncbi:MAG: RDD family protein [Bdellovibrionota bacterium]